MTTNSNKSKFIMHNLFNIKQTLPKQQSDKIQWPAFSGCSLSLALAKAAEAHYAPILFIADDNLKAHQLEKELAFFSSIPVLHFFDWETLPYDSFSPHQDIISDRLSVLSQLFSLSKGIVLISINTLMQRLPPKSFIQGNAFFLKIKQTIKLDQLTERLTQSGYRAVAQVMEHGEFVVRGAIIDLFPMGSDRPYRIELFDNEVETIRIFDPETQRTVEKIDEIHLLPAKEFPLTAENIELFRQQWRENFSGNPAKCSVYEQISQGQMSAGIEYYLPLFFKEIATFLDYLPANTLIIRDQHIHDKAQLFLKEAKERYQQLSHNITHPILPVTKVFISENELFEQANHFPQIMINGQKEQGEFKIYSLPDLSVEHKKEEPVFLLQQFINEQNKKILICAESTGRREVLLNLLNHAGIHPTLLHSWQAFESTLHLLDISIVVAPLHQGYMSESPDIAIVTENELFGQRVLQVRRRKKTDITQEATIRNLAELKLGDPVVHIEQGVGRYQGLQTIQVGNIVDEYLVVEYADKNKLYVPVANLNAISRYAGRDTDHAPLHKLGTEQWENAKQKAAKRAQDVAAELLEIYAKRATQTAYAFKQPDASYEKFAEDFPFEETPDQESAIAAVIADMCSDKPMDRLICGDVGFGKTEVAMRAAFIAANDEKQVALLVPTTLLAQQHYENFKDRFADWPIEIESLSRFRTAQEQKQTLDKLIAGKVDIIIGTHRLLQNDVKFKSLGLIIIDEEHRFGVTHKEKLKKLRENVDVLTLTATPIPRTLNFSLSGVRDLSLIATPPAKRLSIKTFVAKRDDHLIREAILREIMRGGQVYFLHNSVDTIQAVSEELAILIPEAKIGVGHGQMRERDLERVMSDFYHRQFNVLVATTIIESGIDVPSANTIIIDRADKLGLAQLHQLRGRVGRSHHQAYAYLLTPSELIITSDAKKRLEAIAQLEDLGAGFSLATHDLEIRGAGELLGDEQSGHMEEVGFTVYMDMLERAVKSLKQGKKLSIKEAMESPFDHTLEINLGLSALIPNDYVPDIHARLILYKRISGCEAESAISEIKVEIIDRFGMLPEAAENLFAITLLRLKAQPMGIKKITMGDKSGSIEFSEKTTADPLKMIRLLQSNRGFKLEGGSKLRFPLNVEKKAEKFEWLERLLKGLET
jgi:transcription-repair coupling factor (superfamily II helicase)